MEYIVKEDLYYTKEHEWIKIEGNTGIVGISHYASKELGDVAYIELPKLGNIAKGGKMCEIESVKAVSDIYAPISGEIVDVNKELDSSPELINEDPYSAWIVKIEIGNKAELEELLSPQEYTDYIASLQ
jgi:glycine cleavage system H protein